MTHDEMLHCFRSMLAFLVAHRASITTKDLYHLGTLAVLYAFWLEYSESPSNANDIMATAEELAATLPVRVKHMIQWRNDHATPPPATPSPAPEDATKASPEGPVGPLPDDLRKLLGL